MSNRVAVAWLAGLLFAAALIAGLAPVHANGISCGGAFSSGSKIDAITAQYGNAISGGPAVNFEADCGSRRGTQRALVIPALVIGALVGGYLLATQRRREVQRAV